MSVYCIRTLVDFCGVLILTVQHEGNCGSGAPQRACRRDEVLHRQYERYKREQGGHRLINSRCHELKIQIGRTSAPEATSGQAGRGSGPDGERHPAV